MNVDPNHRQFDLRRDNDLMWTGLLRPSLELAGPVRPDIVSQCTSSGHFGWNGNTLNI